MCGGHVWQPNRHRAMQTAWAAPPAPLLCGLHRGHQLQQGHPRWRRSGSQLCDACPEGKHQGDEGASACTECGDGFTCPEGSVVMIPASCEPGTYLNATLELCQGCPAGSVRARAAHHPPCRGPCGSYCVANVSQPTDCPAGTYQNQEGKTACMPCVEGSYCERGSTTPLLCPAGTYGHVNGLRASDDCTDAPAGFYAPAGSIEPTSCPSWGFCPGRQKDTVNDVPGSIPIVVPDGQQAEVRTETVEQTVEETLLQLPLQVEVDDLDAVNETTICLEVATMLGVQLSAVSLDLGTSRRRLDRVHPMPVHRRLTTRQFMSRSLMRWLTRVQLLHWLLNGAAAAHHSSPPHWASMSHPPLHLWSPLRRVCRTSLCRP